MARSKFQPQQQYDGLNAPFQVGQAQGTCDSTGSLIISMSLSATPRAVFVQNIGTQQYFTSVYNLSATGSTARFFGTGSGNVGAVGVTASWQAYV